MKLRLPVNLTLIIALFISLPSTAQVLIPPRGGATAISLNGLWKFKYIASSTVGADSLFFDPKTDVSAWANIKTPGHWDLQGFAEPTYATVKEGTGLYRTTFTAPAA